MDRLKGERTQPKLRLDGAFFVDVNAEINL